MNNIQSSNISHGMPPQKVSSNKKKETKWQESCVNAISNMSGGRDLNGRSSKERKKINYDLINSILDESDFKHILDPYGQGKENIKSGKQPSKLRAINLIVNKINLLVGEEINRPFSWAVMGVSGEVVSEKDKAKKEELLKSAQQILLQEAGIPNVDQIDPNTGEPISPKSFEEIEEYYNYTHQDIREQSTNKILQHLRFYERLDKKFNEGWKHALISTEEIFYIGIVNGEPSLRVCNPINCDFDKNPDLDSIEEGDWFKEERWMTKGQIIDEYGEYLTDSQFKKIDQGEFRQPMSNDMHPGYAYPANDVNYYTRNSHSTQSSSTHYKVIHVVWKSMKKIGFLSYVDEFGDNQESIVNESFKLTPEMIEAGYDVEWTWVPEVWHGTKISEDIIIQVEPVPNQIRSMDNPRKVSLPYVGSVYNSMNSEATSLVDLLKPHLYLYISIWYTIEAEIAKSKGRKFIMDIAQIPKSHGFDVDKWMYHFDNLGIAWINSKEEGRKGDPNSIAQFNQFQAVDVSLSNSVVGLVQILDKIEYLMDKIVGITPQREGVTSSSETATGLERSVTQSSSITEPWFYIHNDVKQRAMTHLLECAKHAYPDKKKLNYILNDVERISYEIDMEKIADSEYNVFVVNTSRDTQVLNALRQKAEQAISSGILQFSDVAKLYQSQSIAQYTRELEKAEIQRNQKQEELQQGQVDAQNNKIKADQEEKEKERMFQAEQKQLDRENKIATATIQSMGFDDDIQGTGRIEALEQGKFALEQSKVAHEHNIKQQELNQEAREKQKDRDLKKQEIESKEKIEKLKAKTALKNKTVGEK